MGAARSLGAAGRRSGGGVMRTRVVGVVYLLYFLTAIAGELVSAQSGVSGFSVPTDAAATAGRLLSHQAAFEMGFAITLVSIALYVALTALLYTMLRPVNRNVALTAALFSVIGQAVAACAAVLQLAPLAILTGAVHLAAFTTEQVQALALLFLQINAQAGTVALLFDGLFLALLGWLIFRSGFLPRALGVLVAAAGIAWLTFQVPPLAQRIGSEVEVLGVVAEAALMLWLLVVGVRSPATRESAI